MKSPKAMNPRLEFTIGASDSTHLRFLVKVWRTNAQLQKARHKAGKNFKDKIPVCDAFCYRHHERHSEDLTLGEIHFCVPKLEVNTVAHEAFHAAVGYAQWVRPINSKHPEDSRDLVADEPVVEESLADSVGYMTEGILWNLRKNRLKVKPL